MQLSVWRDAASLQIGSGFEGSNIQVRPRAFCWNDLPDSTSEMSHDPTRVCLRLHNCVHSKNRVLCKVSVVQVSLLSARPELPARETAPPSLVLTFHVLCPLQSCVGPATEPPQKLQGPQPLIDPALRCG